MCETKHRKISKQHLGYFDYVLLILTACNASDLYKSSEYLESFLGKLPFVHQSVSSFRRHVITERGKKLHSYGRDARNVANGSSERRDWEKLPGGLSIKTL